MQNKNEVSNKNLLLAVLFSALVIIIWSLIFPPENKKSSKSLENYSDIQTPSQKTQEVIQKQGEQKTQPPSQEFEIKGENEAFTLENTGLKIKNIKILSKEGIDSSKFLNSIFTQVGFVSQTHLVPVSTTVWKKISQNQNSATFQTEIANVLYRVKFFVDGNSVINAVFEIENKSPLPITFKMFARVNQALEILPPSNIISHEGAIAYVDGRLHEKNYKKMQKGKFSFEATQNENIWLGISDKYTIVNFVHNNSAKVNFGGYQKNNGYAFQADSLTNSITIQSGKSYIQKFLLFAGSKELSHLEKLSKEYKIPHFDKAIDFGSLYFITKPIFLLLSWIYHHINSFAIAIVVLTVIIKLVLLPLTLKSSFSMAKMKELQPHLKKLQEMYKNDKASLGQATIKLYREKQVNPLAGCLPMLIQIPIFFALYKVLYVSIEMKGQPLFFWIKDLAEPDPTSILNLFGLIPFNATHFLGVLPITFGVSMYLYQKVSPQPADKTQAQIMKMLPVIMTVFLSNFAAGLLFYWIVNNIISVFQQLMIEKVVLPRHKNQNIKKK